MAIAFQAASESAVATGVASFTIPNHPLTSTSEGLAVFVYGYAGATDIITSVTVGGINVPLIGTAAASFAADTAGEPGFVEVYFLFSFGINKSDDLLVFIWYKFNSFGSIVSTIGH